jgi:hypothetical protein
MTAEALMSIIRRIARQTACFLRRSSKIDAREEEKKRNITASPSKNKKEFNS